MPPSRAQRAKTAERRAKAVAMKVAGLDWTTIATRLGYSSKGAACKDVTRALEQGQAETIRNVALLRHLELLRLDRLQAGLWTAAAAGDVKSVLASLQIHDRRVRLTKIDDVPTSREAARSALRELAAGLNVAAELLGGDVDAYAPPDNDGMTDPDADD